MFSIWEIILAEIQSYISKLIYIKFRMCVCDYMVLSMEFYVIKYRYKSVDKSSQNIKSCFFFFFYFFHSGNQE
jgi:hypothetical protein